MTVECCDVSVVLLWPTSFSLAQKRQLDYSVNQTVLPSNCGSVMILILNNK